MPRHKSKKQQPLRFIDGFKALPKEIRDKIWKLVLEGEEARTIILRAKKLNIWNAGTLEWSNITVRTAKYKPAAMLFVCTESRMLALQKYEPFLEHALSGRPIYVKTGVDMIRMAREIEMDYFFDCFWDLEVEFLDNYADEVTFNNPWHGVSLYRQRHRSVDHSQDPAPGSIDLLAMYPSARTQSD